MLIGYRRTCADAASKRFRTGIRTPSHHHHHHRLGSRYAAVFGRRLRPDELWSGPAAETGRQGWPERARIASVDKLTLP